MATPRGPLSRRALPPFRRRTGTALSASTRKRLQHRLEDLGLALAAALFRSLGVDRASRLGGRLWRWLAPLTSRHERALGHLALAMPELDEAERRRIVDAMWDNLGRVFAEGFHLATFAAEPERIELADVEAVARLVGSGRGAVLVSLHMGNWELASLTAMRLGLAPAGVYREVRNPRVEERFRRLRAPFYPAGLHVSRGNRSPEVAMRLLGIVRRGGTVALLGDLREVQGVEVPFFGLPVHATPFPALAARLAGVPLVAARIVRTEGARFRAEAVEVPVPVTADRDADIRAGTAALHAVYEAWIREQPGQWFWIHRKWAPPAAPSRRAAPRAPGRTLP